LISFSDHDLKRLVELVLYRVVVNSVNVHYLLNTFQDVWILQYIGSILSYVMQCQLGLHLMTKEHRNYYSKYFLTLVFASILLVLCGIFAPNAFAMGAPPGFCNNEYDGPITNSTITIGNQTTQLPTSTIKHNTTPNSPNIATKKKFANDWVLDLPSIYCGVTHGSPTYTHNGIHTCHVPSLAHQALQWYKH